VCFSFYPPFLIDLGIAHSGLGHQILFLETELGVGVAASVVNRGLIGIIKEQISGKKNPGVRSPVESDGDHGKLGRTHPVEGSSLYSVPADCCHEECMPSVTRSSRKARSGFSKNVSSWHLSFYVCIYVCMNTP